MAGPLNRSNRAISVSSDAPGLEAGSAPDLTTKTTPRLVQIVWRVMGDGRIALLTLGALLVTRLGTQLGTLINHDTGWYLYAVERLLDGGRLYEDIFVGVNPPLILLLTVPPVAVSRFTGVFAVDLFVLYLYALIGLSLVVFWWLLRGRSDLPASMRNGLVLIAAVILTVSPADQFGQREHFLMVLALPYLALAALRAAGEGVAWPLAALIGVAAALGFGLKPHYLLVPALLEVYLIFMTGRMRTAIRPETLALAATCMLYAGSVALFTPDYLTRIVPYALEVYNEAYRNPLWVNLFRGETVLLPLACMAQLTIRRSQPIPALGDVFLIAASVFFLAYVVQMKGWDYHLYPATTCLTLGFVAIFLNGLLSLSASGRSGPGPVLVFAALIAALVPVAGDSLRGGYRNGFMEDMMPHVERHAAGGSIAILTTNVWPGFPMVNYAGVGWSSRFPTLWLLPGTLRKQAEAVDDERLMEIERYTREAVLADFSLQPPDLVVVDNRENKSYFGDLPFDYIDYFTEDPRFATIWANYEWVVNEGDYRLYRRRRAPAR